MSDVQPQAATLKVPGATLYFETFGHGPPLLFIPGGPQDAGVFTDLARLLADSFTILAYDPRGNSRSTFDGAPTPLDLDEQGDDAARLIEVLGMGPAHVFGTSGGAQIGLNLAARHPHLVVTLIAHEPPTMLLLDDPSGALAIDDAIHQAYLDHGIEAAMGLFFSMNGLEGNAPPPEVAPTPEVATTFERVSGNFDYWLAHGIKPLSRYTPDIDALRRGASRIVVGIGEGSAGQPIHAMGTALATRLGLAPTPFPGDHMGFTADPGRFADAIRKSLR